MLRTKLSAGAAILFIFILFLLNSLEGRKFSFAKDAPRPQLRDTGISGLTSASQEDQAYGSYPR
jgi:hypothetical protein